MTAATRRNGAAELATNRWLRALKASGVVVDPVLAVTLRESAVAVDRAHASDETGGRLAYVARELRAARLDVLALIPKRDAEPDAFTRLLAEFQAHDPAVAVPPD